MSAGSRLARRRARGLTSNLGLGKLAMRTRLVGHERNEWTSRGQEPASPLVSKRLAILTSPIFAGSVRRALAATGDGAGGWSEQVHLAPLAKLLDDGAAGTKDWSYPQARRV
jgi:hypothetical protein